MRHRWRWAGMILLAVSLVTACSDRPSRPASVAPAPSSSSPTAAATPTAPTATLSATRGPSGLAGMPPPLDPRDVWAASRPGALAPAVRGVPPRVYVPNGGSDTVTVVDARTFRVVRTVRVGRQPQHVVPSWDLRTLWVNNNLGNSLTPIDARTGRFGRPVPVDDPYNLYFTPNGRYAVVMASARRELVFRDPHTMAVRKVLPVPCAGVNHADFSADGRYFVVSCEFSGELLRVDTERQRLVAVLRLPRAGGRPPKPQDVKLSSDGAVFYVADMNRGGVWLIDGRASRLRVVGFLRTGRGAHGLYVTRDSRRLLVTNRDEGSISVVDLAGRRVVRTWRIPGGGSPDMGGLSIDGRVFWVSGRYDGVLYAISTSDGRLLRSIRVGSGPHGVCVFPQPGRYSLGHTGVFR